LIDQHYRNYSWVNN